MPHPDRPQPVEPSASSREPLPHRHRGLLVTSGILVAAGMLVTAAYGTAQDLFVLRALAWDLAMVALTVGVCLHAGRLRERFARADGPRADDAADRSAGPRSSGWGSELEEPEEEDLAAEHWDAEHVRKLHYLFLALIPTVLITLLCARGLWYSTRAAAAEAPPAGAATALALVCLAASCVWLMFARAFQAVSQDELPDGPGLALVFREAQWASLTAAAALFFGWLWPDAPLWAGRVLLGWLLVVGVEQLGRVTLLWLRTPTGPAGPVPGWRVVVREALFTHGNPVRSLFDGLEARWGVSFRSSWALRFVRRSVLPTALLVALLLWALSSLAVVQLDELGVRESCGRIQAAALPPGLHWKLPWPFGRVLTYPVKRVSLKPIGFVTGEERQRDFLWSKRHAEEEFALVLGNGSELVAIGCVVYYKVHEDPPRFLDYVYQCQNPDEALEAFAYRTLTEHTRSITLREVLTTNREQFAGRLKEALRDYAESNRLGIEVVDVALIGLHPPVEVAADFLDVISARIDAERVRVEAEGQAVVQTANVQQESASAVARARVDAARRTGEALRESSEFLAMGQAYAVAPEPFQLRLWFEALEEILEEKRFVLIDAAVAEGSGGILLDHRGRAAAGQEDPVPLTRDAGFTSPDALGKEGKQK